MITSDFDQKIINVIKIPAWLKKRGAFQLLTCRKADNHYLFNLLKMYKKISPQLIKKYLNDTCTVEEEEFVHQWYQTFENKENPLSMLSAQQKEELRKRILKRIKNNIATHRERQKEYKTISYRSWIYTLSGVAAVAIVLLSILYLTRKEHDKRIISHLSEQITVTNTTKGIHKQLLPDSSIVWLSPESRLSFPQRFSGEQRVVKMNGEAFFEVTKDHHHPFVIYSGGVITKVWGTSFRIRAYRNIPTKVSVVSGKVSVKIPDSKTSEVMLLPNETATYIKEKKLLKKDHNKESPSMYIWKKASMSFDNLAVKEVISALNKKFNVNIKVQDAKINSYLLKADFTDQNLPDILEMLKASLNVTYEIKDHKIVIEKTAQQ